MTTMFNTLALLILCLLGFSQFAMALTLTADVDRENIALNESLRLVVSIDENAKGDIDFSQLKHQFDIINRQQSNQTSIRNGKVTANTHWVLILAPKESGALIIPSFEYQGVYSPAINITVSENAPIQNKNNANVFLQMQVDKNALYVQEQLLLTFRLYYRIALSNYDSEELTLDNTTIELLAENNFQTDFQGKKYNVLEKVYAIHPQASGELSIPEQSWRLEKSLRSYSLGRSGNPYLYVKSDPIAIKVKPIPQGSTAKNWLPSSAVTLDANWQQSLVQAKVGEPLNYQLTLSANGLTAAQLPDITLPEMDDFTVYSDQAEADNTKSAAGFIGTRTSNFAIIPRTAGRFTFPEVTLKWWNTRSDKEESITLPAQTIIVAKGSVAQNESLPQLPATPEESQQPLNETTSPIGWQVLSLLLLIVCGVLSYFLYKTHSRLKQHRVTPVKTLFTGNNNGQAVIKHIQEAANNKNWPALRQGIIHWGQTIYDDKSMSSLSALAEKLPELKLALQQLDNQLYGQRTDDAYNPNQLVDLIKTIKKKPLQGKERKNGLALQPLYKS